MTTKYNVITFFFIKECNDAKKHAYLIWMKLHSKSVMHLYYNIIIDRLIDIYLFQTVS